jgi:putative endonuclease
MKNFISKSQKIGKLGEDIAAKFLMKHDFLIVDRNYTKKWGEIDIVAEKEDILYFIEVKSISRSLAALPDNNSDVVGAAENFFRPEENMHPWKRRRLARVVETYLISHRIGNKRWQFDLLLVSIDKEHKKARVKTIENIIL